MSTAGPKAHLYIIATPIGNLEDITLRALRVMKEEIDVLLCEDTRVTKKLLSHYNLSVPTESLHSYNEAKKVPTLLSRMQEGECMGLACDAGTPLISDAGYLLVRDAHKAHLSVQCLPGATAFLTACVSAGVPCIPLHFEGFLPHKKGRKKKLLYLSTLPYTWVLYESPHRLIKVLGELTEILGEDASMYIARELTKWYEEVRGKTLAHWLEFFKNNTPKGEYVLIHAPKAP